MRCCCKVSGPGRSAGHPRAPPLPTLIPVLPTPTALTSNALTPTVLTVVAGTSLDLVDRPGLRRWWQPEPLRELLSVFGDEEHSQGVLCADVMLDDGTNPAAIFNSLHECGVTVKDWQVVEMQHGRKGRALRLVAGRV